MNAPALERQCLPVDFSLSNVPRTAMTMLSSLTSREGMVKSPVGEKRRRRKECFQGFMRGKEQQKGLRKKGVE